MKSREQCPPHIHIKSHSLGSTFPRSPLLIWLQLIRFHLLLPFIWNRPIDLKMKPVLILWNSSFTAEGEIPFQEVRPCRNVWQRMHQKSPSEGRERLPEFQVFFYHPPPPHGPINSENLTRTGPEVQDWPDARWQTIPAPLREGGSHYTFKV